jgi:hypothetical protein
VISTTAPTGNQRFDQARGSQHKQIYSQSPRAKRGLTAFQEIELKSHLCLVIAAKIEETDDIQGTSDRIPHSMMLKELRKASRN